MVYVSNRNKYFNVANYQPISRAYFKLWEILYDINFRSGVKNINTTHIAEGPGGFIEATINYCLKNNINLNKIEAITLIEDKDVNIPFWNIGQKMIKDNDIQIHYGKDNTGNIYHIENIIDFVIKVGKNSCDLVTADGGIDYSTNYNKQEQMTYRLLLCEIAIALSIQNIGGTFIFKIFDISTRFTIELLYILYKSYEELIIHKPYTSRSANSEKYVICKGFQGFSNDNIKKIYYAISEYDDDKSISLIDYEKYISNDKSFIDKIIEYNKQYIEHQIYNINNTLSRPTRDEYKIQIKNAYRLCTNYEIPINKNNKYSRLEF